MSKKVRNIGLITIFCLFFTAGIINNIIAGEESEGGRDVYENLQLISDVLFQIKKYYIEDIDIDKLTDAAIKGMLDELDPHTYYFREDDYANFKSDADGEFNGLGISIEKLDDYITVVYPMDDTPAFRAGILSGDKIIAVNGKSIKGISTDDVINQMRGAKGTKVKLTISRPGAVEELVFEIIRDEIKVKSLPFVFKTEEGIGYIRMTKFSRQTADEFIQALDRLEKEGIRGLLVDLRFNPGGLLDQAVETVNEFVGKDKKVVFTRGRYAEANQEFFTSSPGMRSGYPVIVLINDLSASAAEIFAGSLQDFDKALVVGERSFGKGSVQQLFNLSEGKGMKITTSKYYIHSGRCIHKDKDSDSLTVFYTENGRKVFGGGGITPDITIKQRELSQLERDIRNGNLTMRYALEVLTSEYPQNIESNFEISQDDYDGFLEFSQVNGVTIPENINETEKQRLISQISAELIGNKLGSVARFKALVKTDDQLVETLEIFKKFNSLPEMFSYSESLKR